MPVTGITSFPLAGTCTVRQEPPLVVPDAITSRIDAIWAEEKRQRGADLTNGRIYSLVDHQRDCLLVCPAEYRHVLARRRDPDLIKAGLTIRPLAVTGILRCADGLVLGRRGGGVASDAGLWEPAPAGGLATPDPEGQLFEELEEELGLDRSTLCLCEICGLVDDVETGVCDIVFRMRTGATRKDIRDAHAAAGSSEYADLAVVETADVPDFLQANRDCLLPALVPMLRLAGVV